MNPRILTKTEVRIRTMSIVLNFFVTWTLPEKYRKPITITTMAVTISASQIVCAYSFPNADPAHEITKPVLAQKRAPVTGIVILMNVARIGDTTITRNAITNAMISFFVMTFVMLSI